LERYQKYVDWIGVQDLTKVKFMDEVHNVSKQVSHTRALGDIVILRSA